MAKYANQVGNFSVDTIGEKNQETPIFSDNAFADALKQQSAICFLPCDDLVQEIALCTSAGLGVFLGNSTAVSGSQNDRNGITVAKIKGKWAHATSFTDYKKTGNTEYIGWLNSWGSIYSQGYCEGWGLWMNFDTAESFLKSAAKYGEPVAILSESEKLS
jgi:hypothetical protein